MPLTARQINLRKKCDVAGLFLAGGVTDLTNLIAVELMARGITLSLTDPAVVRISRERGFEIIAARKNQTRPKKPNSTRLMAAAGHHIILAGLDPEKYDAPTIIGAVAFQIDALGEETNGIFAVLNSKEK